MKTKIIKLFGIKVLEVIEYDKDEQPLPTKPRFGKPKGEILTYTPLEQQRDKDRETLKKMKGK